MILREDERLYNMRSNVLRYDDGILERKTLKYALKYALEYGSTYCTVEVTNWTIGLGSIRL